MTLSIVKLKGLIQVFFNYALELVTSVIVLKIASVSLSKADFGFYSLIISVFTLISILPFFSLHTAIERISIEYKLKKISEKFYALFFIPLFFAIIYLALLFGFKRYLGEQWNSIIYIFYFFSLTKIYRAFYVMILNVQEKRKIIIISKIVDTLIQVGILLIAMFYEYINIEIIFYSSIAGNALSLLVYILAEKKEYKYFNFNVRSFFLVLNEVLVYSYPLLIWSFFIWAQNMLGRWYIDYFLDKVWVANYSLMTSLALLPSIAFISIFAGFFVPIFYKSEGDSPGYIRRYNKKVFAISLAFWVVAIILTFLLKDWFIVIFLDKKYLDISWMLPYLMIGTAFYSIGQVSIYEIYYYKAPKKLILSNVLPGVLSIILGYFLIMKYKINGAIITYVVSFCFSGILTIITSRKFSNNLINYSK